jgi:hypothetical protein
MADEADHSLDAEASTDNLLNALFEKAPGDKQPIPQEVPKLQTPKPTPEGEEEPPPDDEETSLAKLIGTEDEASPEEGTQPSIEFGDDTEVEVKVDEKPHKVTLKELKANYSGQKFIEKRIEQASEARKVAEQQANALFEKNNQVLAKLQQIDAVLGQVSSQNINWDELKARDPLQYALKREEWRDAQDKQNLVRQEAAKVAQQQEQLSSDAKNRFIASEAEALQEKMPEVRDPDKAKALMEKLTSTATTYGYTKQELESVMDHRALLVLRDAARYRDLVAKRETLMKKVEPTVPVKTLRTVASQPANVASQRKDKAILNRARETGRPEDVALTLLVPARKKG